MKTISNSLTKLSGRTLILTHHNADVDAITSAMALAKFVKADIGVAESVSRAARAISEGVKIIIDPDCIEYDNVILVDTSVPEQLRTVKNLRADYIIDHHIEGPLVSGAKDSWVDHTKRSTAQMVFRIIKTMGKVDQKTAELIIAGIVTDTAYLKIANQEVFEDIVELLKTGIKYEDVLKKITVPIDESERIACLKSISHMDSYRVGKLLVSFAKSGSHEAAIARALLRIGADIGIAFAEKSTELRISSRGVERISECGISLSEIFKQIGPMIHGTGGGHDMAGSANGKPTETGPIKSFILEEIAKKVNDTPKKL